MYSRMTFSFLLPILSAKYPSPQKLSPHKNSSSSGNSRRMTRLLPPFSNCTTLAILSRGLVCIKRWTWSFWILISCNCQSLTSAACLKSSCILETTLPLSTLRRYFGHHTRWVRMRCFVDAPLLYITIKNHHDALTSVPQPIGCVTTGGHSSPPLKGRGFLPRY